MSKRYPRHVFKSVVSLLCLVLLGTHVMDEGAAGGVVEVKFVNVASQAGVTSRTVYGDERKNKYLLETTGSGAAFFDYDGDRWQDIFLVNGTRLDPQRGEQSPTNRLYRNKGDGTFQDVTDKSGLRRTGWGQGVCVGDYDNDGNGDLFISAYGKNALYRNQGDGTFTDVSQKSGVRVTNGTYGLGVLVADFDDDAWPDVYVANDSAPAALYHNNHDGTFTDVGVEAGAALSIDGKPQAGMGVAAGDYDRDGIGARVRCVTADAVQTDEVRSGGSYYSQNDLRVHFGLGQESDDQVD